MDLGYIASVLPKLLLGLRLTLALTLLALTGGLSLALALNFLRQSSFIGAQITNAYVYIFRGSPLLIQLFLIYYGLAQFSSVRHSLLWPVLKDPFYCAALAMALNDAAYTSEILRAALKSITPGVLEAAEVAGMPRALILCRIVLLLAFRQALPAYTAGVTTMIKATSLASVVTLMEITGIARAEVSETYRAIEVFLAAAVIYLFIVSCFSYGAQKLEDHLAAFRRPAVARSPS
jgi:octopine/nopaline transport system permease protein